MDTFDLYSLMERDHVLLAFKGSITSDLLTSVLQIMESIFELDLHIGNEKDQAQPRFVRFIGMFQISHACSGILFFLFVRNLP